MDSDEVENQGNPKRAKYDKEMIADNENGQPSNQSSVDPRHQPMQLTDTNGLFELDSIDIENDIREIRDMNRENSDDSNVKVGDESAELHENDIDSSLESTSSNHVHLANMDKIDVEPDEQQTCENAGPSKRRLSHSSRNYRRRVDESSSDDEEDFQFPSIKNSQTEPLVASTTERSVIPQASRHIEDIIDSDTNSHNDDSSDSFRTQSTITDSSDWSEENEYSSADSNDRFGFEPNEEIDEIVQTILQKTKPKYAWRTVPSIMYRQNGLREAAKLRRKITTPYDFQASVRGSLHVVERFQLMGKLAEHYGCINCLNFNQSGKYLASGSDDLKIKIWNWATQKVHVTIHTSHTANIFQAKFIDYNGYEGCFELVSSDQSGAIRHYAVKPCGSVESERILCNSPRSVHKLGLPSNCPYEVLSAGEDARVMLMDLREKTATRLFKADCPLYSIACHPINSNEFCVGGHDQFVRVYDRRSYKSTLRIHCPQHLQQRQVQLRSVTSAVYNYIGSEILATYSNENIYLFDSTNNEPGGFLHKYSGHRNNRTIKGVNFYGPRSEFVVSGSENPGHVFLWEKETEAIVQMMIGDIGGVVNCIESHPYVPVLATSGLSEEIRLWHPSNHENAELSDLKKYVNRNINVQMSRNADRSSGMDFIQFILERMRQRQEDDFETRADDEASQSIQNDSSDDERDTGDNSMDTYELNPCNTS